MTCSPAQLAANRKNAGRSTGPRTDQGKAISRANATKHGLATESPEFEASLSPAFLARREAWGARYPIADEVGAWALDRAVAASFRIERCEQTVEAVVDATAQRAEFSWQQDQTIKAASLMARLAKDPSLVARKLETTAQGVALKVEWWKRLEAPLAEGDEWSDDEASTALDLLGVPTHLRKGRTPIDSPDPGFRRDLAAREVARLDDLKRTALDRVDELEQAQNLSGDIALLGPSVKLVLRYEREAWRHYRESIAYLVENAPDPDESPGPDPVVAVSPPTPPPPAEEEHEYHARMMAQAREAIGKLYPGLDFEGEMSDAEFDAYFSQVDPVDGTNPIGRAAAILRASGMDLELGD